MNISLKLSITGILLTLASCSNNYLQESIAGVQSQSPLENTVAVTSATVEVLALKGAFSQVNKDWHAATRKFNFGKIPDPDDRAAVKAASESINTTLAQLQSVRKGDIVQIGVVLKDIVMFRENMRPSVAILEANLKKHGGVALPERRLLYERVVKNLKFITSNRWNELTPDVRLMLYLEAISTVATLVKEYKE